MTDPWFFGITADADVNTFNDSLLPYEDEA